jgi:thiosulfate dehydrogenase [quinone] large subunit
MKTQKNIYTALRIVMGFIFTWAFLDKLFGLGFATTSARAWINGGSPTFGFLSNSPTGPFADFFNSLAGLPVVDWMFMLGLIFIGLTLLLNKYIVWGSIAGMVLMLLMYLAVLPPSNNPLVDEHIVYILVLALLALQNRNKFK